MNEEKIKENSESTGCLICGQPIVYNAESVVYTCHFCKKRYESNAVCENGHYVCDKCHSSAQSEFLRFLCDNDEKDPIALFQQVAELKSVHMHGPEHHSIVPCVLLTSYRNNGGAIDFVSAIEAAVKRGGQIPGGTCGYWGACGAAIGAGIYASIITVSNPLNVKAWHYPQLLTSRCLARISELGGPRCCKRTSRVAIETAALFTQEHMGISIPVDIPSDGSVPIERMPCSHSDKNRECIRVRCPYYGG